MPDNRKNGSQSMDTANRAETSNKKTKGASNKAENNAQNTKGSSNCR